MNHNCALRRINIFFLFLYLKDYALHAPSYRKGIFSLMVKVLNQATLYKFFGISNRQQRSQESFRKRAYRSIEQFNGESIESSHIIQIFLAACVFSNLCSEGKRLSSSRREFVFP